jgi:uncharacterized protein (TIGR02646 family)
MGERTQSMKKCLKSSPEPVCLTDFRTSNPKATWDDFRNQDPGCYSSIRTLTRNDQCGICAYCEIRLDQNDEQIAHFHPKSDISTTINWALDWNNLWIACKGGTQPWLPNHLPPLPANRSCDENKGNKIVDGIVFSPQDILAFPRLFSYEQSPGGIAICVDIAECTKAGINPGRVQQTIDEFNLNCTRLAIARMTVHKVIEREINGLMKSSKNPKVDLQKLIKKHLAKDSNGHWPMFFTLIRWRFRQTAESHLQSIGYSG